MKILDRRRIHDTEYPSQEYLPLFFALLEDEEKRAWGELEKLEGVTQARDACILVTAGVGVEIGLFCALLDRCPPPAEFCRAEDLGGWCRLVVSCGPVEMMAYCGRPEHLDALLRRGASPNPPETDWEVLSPLGAALEGRDPRCVRRLLEEPELILDPRDYDVLSLWSKAGQDEETDSLLRLLCPRWLGVEAEPEEPVPLPPNLSVAMTASGKNWPLVARIARERGEREPVRRNAEEFVLSLGAPYYDAGYVRETLDEMLKACPWLRHSPAVISLTVMHGLRAEILGEENRLAGWLEQMTRGEVILHPGPMEWTSLLSFWREQGETGFHPVLDRGAPAPLRIPEDGIPEKRVRRGEKLEALLAVCAVRGELPEQGLSPLAEDVLLLCRPDVVERQFAPGGLLAAERGEDLLEFVRGSRGSPGIRGILLCHVWGGGEARYSL